jgi:hypothetical protein
MKLTFRSLACVLAVSVPLVGHANCDSIKDSIDGKIKARFKGDYSLTIIDAADKDKADGKVIGNCDDMKKLIVFKRGAAAAAPPPK